MTLLKYNTRKDLIINDEASTTGTAGNNWPYLSLSRYMSLVTLYTRVTVLTSQVGYASLQKEKEGHFSQRPLHCCMHVHYKKV